MRRELGISPDGGAIRHPIRGLAIRSFRITMALLNNVIDLTVAA